MGQCGGSFMGKPLRTALGWKVRREMTQAGTTAASGRKRLTRQKRNIIN
jgi:hypothetical protein